MIAIAQETPTSHDALWLLHNSCAYIRDLYPEDHAHTFKLSELEGEHGRFFVVRADDQAIGCGAFVYRTPSEIELKHIYLTESARGMGCGRALLHHIENVARELGVQRIVLETGPKQPAACALYEKFGYRLCESYIAHPLPHAIFMEKLIECAKLP